MLVGRDAPHKVATQAAVGSDQYAGAPPLYPGNGNPQRLRRCCLRYQEHTDKKPDNVRRRPVRRVGRRRYEDVALASLDQLSREIAEPS
jgi:hypothetical protein